MPGYRYALTTIFLLLTSLLLAWTDLKVCPYGCPYGCDGFLLPVFAYAQEAPVQPSALEHGIELSDKGEFNAAIEVFKGVSAMNPDDPMPYFHMAAAYFRLKEYDLAIESLEMSLKLKPDLASAHTGLGAIYEIKGENGLARREYVAAIKGGDSEAEKMLRRLDAKERKERMERMERLRSAEALFKEGRLEESLKELDLILRQSPNDVEVLYNAGFIYARMRRYKEARENLSKVVEKEPGNIDAHLQLGYVYNSAGDYNEAKKEFEAVINISPEGEESEKAREFLINLGKRIEVTEYFKQASEYREKKELDAALSAAQKILAIEPENILALYDMGITYSMMGKNEEAVDVLKSAIKINAGYVEAHLALGIIYESLRRYEEAVEEYRLATGKDTGESKKAAERLETLKRALEAKERSERIRVFMEQGNMEAALNEAEVYVSEENKNPKAHLTLGKIYLRFGRVKEAITRLKTAVEIVPKYWEAYLLLGEAYEAMGKYEEAREAYRTIVSGAPDTPEGREAGQRVRKAIMAIHFERAKGLLGKGDFEGALREIQMVREIAPDNPVALYNSGVIYDRLERPEEAEEFLKRALQVSPDYVQAHLQLALVYERGQRFEEAREEYKVILSITEKGREADIARVKLGRISEIEALSGRIKNVQQLMSGGDYIEAQKEIEGIITISPGNYIAYYMLGIILDRMDRREEAITALKRSTEIKEDYAPARLYLGTVYEKENMFQDAREEYKKAMTVSEGTGEGEIAAIRFQRLKNWKGSFSISHSIDTNLSYGVKRVPGVGSGYSLSLSYFILRTKGNILSAGLSSSRSMSYKNQLWGEGYNTNARWEITLHDIYRLSTGWNYNYSLFDSEPSYRSYGLSGNASVTTGGIPTSFSMGYSFSNTDSFRSKASDAYQHSVSLSSSQRFSAKDTISASYSFSSYVNKEQLGSNYANRSNNISASYSRFIRAGLSASAGYAISLVQYMNPDSTTLYSKFRRNVSQTASIDLSYSLSEKVSMSLGFDYTNASTNLPRPTSEEQQKLEDILAAPIPTVGGGYKKLTVGIGFGVAF
ncbi:MAG: tetratricopeptide repeat protein [Nitrospirae bacterium]|nr:tetratricopeptide repeat protein [Nitrospirota bacterium]